MGLDMYFTKRLYVKNWEHMDEKHKHKITITKGGKPADIEVEKISEVVLDVGYWRKANHIHNWFVQNVQDGEDNCKDYWVSREQIKELLDTCKKVLKASKLVKGKVSNGQTLKDGKWVDIFIDGKVIEDPTVAQELLPTSSGFFFGGTDYDEWYIKDIKDTIKMLTPIIKNKEDRGDYYYSSSW